MQQKQAMLLTQNQNEQYQFIETLQRIISNAKLSETEIVQQLEMTKKQKEKLVSEIYFENKKKKEFYTCSDGRVKSYNPQFIAKTKEELIDKLYTYYFHNVLKSVYEEWVQYRAKTKIVSMKTIEEDIGIWKRFLQDSEIAEMQIAAIKPKHLLKLFQEWTGNGLITRKDFNNRKSLLNGIFRYAVLNEIIPYNPITSLPCNELKFKCPTAKKKAYTVQERSALLAHLKKQEPDAYTLAIMLSFYGIFRIGEIKALEWDGSNEKTVTIRQQLVEERDLKEDMTLGQPHRVLKAISKLVISE